MLLETCQKKCDLSSISERYGAYIVFCSCIAKIGKYWQLICMCVPETKSSHYKRMWKNNIRKALTTQHNNNIKPQTKRNQPISFTVRHKIVQQMSALSLNLYYEGNSISDSSSCLRSAFIGTRTERRSLQSLVVSLHDFRGVY